MSRSRKRIPVTTYLYCKSRKKDKRICNRRFRRKSKVMLQKGKDPPARLREVMNAWTFAGIGKHIVKSEDSSCITKILRK